MSFVEFESAQARLLAWGGATEVLDPEALRLSLQDYAAQIAQRYAA
jgi:predicted DNA-binding transcriptional regulator YafY